MEAQALFVDSLQMHPSHFLFHFRAATEQGLDFVNNNQWLKGRFSQSAFILLAWLVPSAVSCPLFLRCEQAVIENSRALPINFNITWLRWGEYFDV